MNENHVAHEAPWHAAYPAPKSEAVGMSQSDLLAMMQDGKEPGKDFILIDLRRNDHAVRDKREK
jgi:arsenical-resistance protein 2